MLDSHLAYISTGIFRAGEHARYDVYPSGGGNQLGWVVNERNGWHAEFGGPGQGRGPVRRTRWEAATAVWGLAWA